MPPKFSLQQRLLTRTLGAVLVVWVITAAYVWFEAQHEVDELLDAHLAQSAALLVVQQNATPDDDEPLLEAPTLHKYAHRVAYQVFDEDRLVMHSPNVAHTPMAKHTQGFDTLTLADGQSWRIFAAPGRARDVQIYVAERVDSRDEILRAVLRGFLPPLTVALPLLLLGLWWNVRSGLQPLQRLRQALLKRDTQTLTPVSLPDTPQEVQPMLDALNDLLQRLAQRMETERRFTADAAHELRTPIAAIRAQAQVALTSASNDQVRQHALQDTLLGCDRASRVVEQLLTLARVDGPQDVASEPFRLDQLAQHILADLAPEALRRGQTLELLAPDALQVNGQSTLWHILLRNLVDNALRYSPDGAVVRIQIERMTRGQVTVTVQDSGPGLSPADTARLGERFFRVLGTVATGSGLGWSIVRHIAALQHIDVQVGRSADLGGLQVTLRYPHR
ncbi:two-component sensor histidine kinase [Limnohabitans sp. TS-CS-82]|uniref:ATP-binding protein n=1 Tax=Limnohabitans sp. TS-CS-82 TaxID=2094193 RepID=UPI000CF2C8FA|nr:ATP-binding protein [Limnohabitans sp. TS-CS-82]PQA79867.1 two-component sensor histidine kinase [Limnohabitans sp. TS-CS-82]